MARLATCTVETAIRRRACTPFLLTLIVLTLALALPAVAASRATSNGRTFEFRAAQTTALGTVVVDSQPTSADVRLDGVDAGLSTPTTFTGLPPDVYRLSVTIPGFQAWEESVNVTTDVTTTVQAALLVALPATVSAVVTVATTSDAIEGDVSNIVGLKADPGPDGTSLREALTAANATAGTKVIRFAPVLKDAVITPGQVTKQRLPILTGGDVWIWSSGDVARRLCGGASLPALCMATGHRFGDRARALRSPGHARLREKPHRVCNGDDRTAEVTSC
jgi:hypothetical protein